MYAIFDSIESFNIWHAEIKNKLGIPYVGFNQATGKPDSDHPTLEFTTPIINPDDLRVIANVADMADGLDIVNQNDSRWSGWFPQHTWTITDNN